MLTVMLLFGCHSTDPEQTMRKEAMHLYYVIRHSHDLPLCKGLLVMPRGSYSIVSVLPSASNAKDTTVHKITAFVSNGQFEFPDQAMTDQQQERVLNAPTFLKTNHINGGLSDCSANFDLVEFGLGSDLILVKSDDPSAFSKFSKIYKTAHRIDDHWFYYQGSLY